MQKGSVGIVGLNSCAVAESAKKTGFKVYLIDYFSDMDAGADYHLTPQKNPLKPNLSAEYSAEKLAEFAIENLGGIVDNLILTSGIGCNSKLVKKLERHFEIRGNSSERIKKAKDWKGIKRILDRIGISYPETIVAKSANGVEDAVYKSGYPVVVKSMIKSTGILPTLIRNETETKKFCRIIQKKKADILIQKYIRGIPISVSLLSDGENTMSLSVNRQLIGIREFGASRDFTYCGHIVPFGNGVDKGIIYKSSEEIISDLKLIGSNGIDYVLSGDGGIFFMEINPRFQDTISSVEKFCRINLVEMHLKAIDGIIECPVNQPKRCYGKGIIFAKKDVIASGLGKLSGVANTPRDGTCILKGEPVCSIFAGDKGNKQVMNKLLMKARSIQKMNLL